MRKSFHEREQYALTAARFEFFEATLKRTVICEPLICVLVIRVGIDGGVQCFFLSRLFTPCIAQHVE